MAEDNSIEVKFKAVIGDFLSKLSNASDATKEHTEKMTGSFEVLGRGMEGCMKTLGALGAILAGGAMFKEAIKETVAWTGEVMKLSRSLGINTEAASGMAVALHHLGVPVEDFASANNKLTRQMRTNEEAFGKLGIATKDASGEWRNSNDVMLDSIAKLNGMEAGTNRNVAAQALFGGRMSDLGPLLRLNADLVEESTKKAKEYHLEIGPEGAAKARAYKESLADLDLVKKSLSVQVGNVLLPVLLKLGKFLGEHGPQMAEGFGYAISCVVQVFYLLKAVIETIVTVATGAVMMMIAGWRTVGEVVQNVVTGNFKGAAAAAKAGFQEIRNEAEATAEGVADAWKNFTKSSKELWEKKDVKAGKASGSDTLGGDSLGKDGKDKKENPFGEWEKELALAKAAFVKEYGDLAVFDSDYEIAFWQTKAKNAKAGSDEWAKATLKASELVKKADADAKADALKAEQEKIGLAKLAAQDSALAAKDAVERRKLELNQLVALGRMSKEQELAELKKFREDALKEEIAQFEAEQKLLVAGSVAWQAAENKKTEARRKAGLEQTKLETSNAITMAKQWEATAKKVGESLGTVFGALITHSMTMQQAMSQILKIALSELLKYAMSVVTAKAAEAGAGAAASAAQTPVVGWAMAIPAMGAVLAAVLGLGSSIGSAENGWDIPAGVNPVAQLHQREMVLPAEQADVIRGMAAGGGGGGGHTFHIHAMDAQSFESFLRQNTGALVRVSNEAAKNGRRA